MIRNPSSDTVCWPATQCGRKGVIVKVLRISHSAVVTSWRERDRQLRRVGIDVRLVSARAWDEGGRLVRFSADGDGFVTPARTFGSHPNLFCFDPRPLWRELGQSGVDLIDIHEEPCSVATAEVLLIRWIRRVRVPFLVYSAQNIDKRYPIPFRWIERYVLHRAAGAYPCNAEAARILHRKGLLAPAPVVPLGVDINHFAAAERSPPVGTLHVGYVGRLTEHKGVAVLIDAVAGDDSLTLVLVGGGPAESDLRQRVVRLGCSDRISFRGHASADEIADHYRSFDVVVVPSLSTPRWLEQFCRVAVEAMAAGVPVIATRSGALPEVVADGGVLVAERDPLALRSVLLELLSAPEEWLDLRERAIARAARFAWGEVAARTADLYQLAAPDQRDPVAAVPSQDGMPAPPIEVVIVAFGSARLVADCLRHLGGSFPVTVVDNSSSADTRSVVEANGACYIDPGRNLGFAAGVNRALREIGGFSGDVLLLNPDAAVTADQVRTLQRGLWSEERLGVVAPSQVDPRDGSRNRVSWPFPTPAGAWIEAVGLGRLRRRSDFVVGAVLLIKSQVFVEVGGFDEQFFLYAEEIDWEIRARSAGWRCAEIASVTAAHEGAGTGGDPTLREMYFHASHELLIRKHYGAPGWQSYRLATILGSLVRAALLPGCRGRRAACRAKLYLRGPARVQREYADQVIC